MGFVWFWSFEHRFEHRITEASNVLFRTSGLDIPYISFSVPFHSIPLDVFRFIV